MASISEEEEILEAAVTGIPRVAEAVASIPEKARAKALAAVESTYRQTMLDLGYEEGLLRVGFQRSCFDCKRKSSNKRRQNRGR